MRRLWRGYVLHGHMDSSSGDACAGFLCIAPHTRDLFGSLTIVVLVGVIHSEGGFTHRSLTLLKPELIGKAATLILHPRPYVLPRM